MGYVGVKPSAVPLTSADITDNIIVNADINSSAAIALTKLASTGTLTVDNIQFPATAVASANANNLDDYEEGTWTPTAWGTGTISSASGRYIKIGKQVYISWKVTYGSTASGDTAGFQNTPFAPFNNESATGCTTIANTDYGSAFTARVIENGSRVIFYTFANGSLTNANFSTKFVTGGAVYEVA
jgi:hypothetical protein